MVYVHITYNMEKGEDMSYISKAMNKVRGFIIRTLGLQGALRLLMIRKWLDGGCCIRCIRKGISKQETSMKMGE